jgi:hypothetical protein
MNMVTTATAARCWRCALPLSLTAWLTPLLEISTFVSGQIFHFYRVFLPLVQMRAFVRYKCPFTEANRSLIQPLDINVRPTHLYRPEKPPGINVITLIRVRKHTGTNVYFH